MRVVELAIAALAPALAAAFGFEDVDQRAAALAKKAYEAPKVDLPAALRNLDYDQFRDIRYKAERNLWHAENLPFEIAFFHRGGIYREGVKMH